MSRIGAIREREANEADAKYYGSEFEMGYFAQEWGNKNNLRLFGIIIGVMDFHGRGGPAEKNVLRVKGIFIDPAFKSMELHVFDIKENSGDVTKTKKLKGFKWPIKFARTKEFDNLCIIPVYPLYQVLVDRGIILPFQNCIKKKEWAALPFEDKGNMKCTKI